MCRIDYLTTHAKPELLYPNIAYVLRLLLKSHLTIYSMRPNFSACASAYDKFSKNSSIYKFNNTPHGIFSDPGRKPSSLITYEGCKVLCGTGTQFYAWAAISSTITTWVMMMTKLCNSNH